MQLQDEEDDSLCRICMDAVIDCVLLECGHMVTCTKCGKRMSECPICRQYVVRAVHVFKSWDWGPSQWDTPMILPQTSECIKDWKLTVPRQRLFLKVIFITDWGQKVHPKTGLYACGHMAFPAFAGFYHLFPLSTSCWGQTVSVGICSCSMEACLLISPLPCVWNLCSLRNELIVHKWASVDYTEQWLLWMFTLLVMYILNANIWWM